jgi:uncharacterized protein
LPTEVPESDPPAVTCFESVTDVLRRLGEHRPLQRNVELPGLVVGAVHVREDAPVVVDATVESVREGVLVSGELRVPWVGECRRCLGPVEGVLAIDVRELFERKPTPGESYALLDERIDLVPLITDAVLLSLPLAPLCSDDCRGPDPERFPAQPAVDDDDGPPADPRWAALADVAFDLRDVAAQVGDVATDSETDSDTGSAERG